MTQTFAALAAGAGHDTSPELLTRLWDSRVKAKDWPGAARIADHPGLSAPLRDRVQAHPNAEVRCAFLRRNDLAQKDQLDVAAGETRVAVLKVVCEVVRRSDLRAELVDLLLAAWVTKPTRGTAVLIMETATENDMERVPADQAWPIMRVALACESPHAPDMWRSWLAWLRGADVSVALVDSRVSKHMAFGWNVPRSWAQLLTRPGRDAATVRADTDAWLSTRVLRMRVGEVAAAVVHVCGPTPEAKIVLEQILAWAQINARASVADVVASQAKLTGAVVVAIPAGFGATPEPEPVVTPASLWADYDDCVSSWPVRVDPQSCGPRPLVIACGPRDRRGDTQISSFVDSGDDSLAAAGWLLAARTLHGTWPEASSRATRARFRDRPDVLAALDVCTGPHDVFTDLTGDDRCAAALGLLRTLAGSPALIAGEVTGLFREAQDWLLGRGSFDLVPWKVTADLIVSNSNESDRFSAYRSSAHLIEPLADWLVTAVEGCPDPVRVWALIDAVSDTFDGSTADLLDSVADIAGVPVSFTRTPAPVSDVVITVVE